MNTFFSKLKYKLTVRKLLNRKVNIIKAVTVISIIYRQKLERKTVTTTKTKKTAR